VHLIALDHGDIHEEEAGRRLAAAVVGGVLGLVVLPPLAPVLAGLPWAVPRLRARRRRRARLAAVARNLPDAVDQFVLVVGAGLTVPLAVEAVARRAPEPIAVDLRRVAEEVRLGRRLADALGDVPARLGEPARPLVAALVASERYGAPLLDRLVRLSAEVRADRRRRAEEAARRVPVKLLFPLVLCTLPAFALLTVVPLLAGALRSLRL
jgi:tight adherence protein C